MSMAHLRPCGLLEDTSSITPKLVGEVIGYCLDVQSHVDSILLSVPIMPLFLFELNMIVPADMLEIHHEQSQTTVVYVCVLRWQTMQLRCNELWNQGA